MNSLLYVISYVNHLCVMPLRVPPRTTGLCAFRRAPRVFARSAAHHGSFARSAAHHGSLRVPPRTTGLCAFCRAPRVFARSAAHHGYLFERTKRYQKFAQGASRPFRNPADALPKPAPQTPPTNGQLKAEAGVICSPHRLDIKFGRERMDSPWTVRFPRPPRFGFQFVRSTPYPKSAAESGGPSQTAPSGGPAGGMQPPASGRRAFGALRKMPRDAFARFFRAGRYLPYPS